MYKVLTQGGSEMLLRNDKVNKLIEDKVAHILIDKDGKTTTITEAEVDKIKEDICCNFQPHEIQSYLNKYRRVK